MTTAYTSLLGLALPVTGELSGTWGDTVNNAITSLLDTAVAGTTTLSTDADVTLTTTTGASNQARQAIILWTASGTVTRNITAPAQSKIYTVINKTGSTQSIVIRGAGPTTGVTIVAGESAQVAWNGTDFVKLSSNSRFDAPVVIEGTTTDAALRITQLGTGNALLVEDSSNPDSTPFVIDASGNVVQGYTSSLSFTGPAGTITPTIQAIATASSLTQGLASTTHVTSANGPNFIFGKSRGASASAPTIVSSGDAVGSIVFSAYDGAAYLPTAYIQSLVDGTPGTNDMPGRLIFSTTADGASSPTERMRIDSAGRVGIGASASTQRLRVQYNVSDIAATTSSVTADGTHTLTADNAWGYAAVDAQAALNQGGFNATISLASGGSVRNRNYITVTGASGTVTAAVGSLSDVRNIGAGTLTNAAGFVTSFTNSGGGTLTNTYGFYAGAATAGTNNYGFYGNIASGTGRYNVYMAGTADNYFAGNVGIGVTPSAWGGGYKALQVNGAGLMASSGYVHLGVNNYFNGTNDIYISSLPASYYIQTAGAHKWYNAPSGTAGNPITFTQAMTLDASGNLGIGTTSPSTFGKLAVYGSGTAPVIGAFLGSNSPATGATLADISFGARTDGTVTAIIRALANDNGNGTDGQLTFWTADNTASAAAAERARIDSSGRLLINLTTARTNFFGGSITPLIQFEGTSSATRFQSIVYNNAGTNAGILILGKTRGSTVGSNTAVAAEDETGQISFQGADGTNLVGSANIAAYVDGAVSSGVVPGRIVFQTSGSTVGSNLTERARIDSSGNLLVGTTSASASSGAGVKIRPGQNASISIVDTFNTNANDTLDMYSTNAGAYRFYVDWGGTIHATSTTIAAISDERLKENIKDIDTGLDAVMALKPRRFDWKEGKGQDKKNAAGFIAQEFETVFPDSVGLSKAGEDGVEYKNICHEELIPTLVKAIQELKAELDTAKEQIAILQGAK